MASVSEYAWTAHDPTFDAYCLDYVENATSADVIEALVVHGPVTSAELPALAGHSWQTWARHDADRIVVGMMDVVVDLSRGRSVFEHSYRADTGIGTVARLLDGEVRTSFTTQYPQLRHGVAPDEMNDLIRGVGIEVDTVAGHPPQPHRSAAVLALCEAVTGVAMTRTTLHSNTFHVAEVVLRPWVIPEENALHSEPWTRTRYVDLYNRSPYPRVSTTTWRDHIAFVDDDEVGARRSP